MMRQNAMEVLKELSSIERQIKELEQSLTLKDDAIDKDELLFHCYCHFLKQQKK
jgi:hypothetical protein